MATGDQGNGEINLPGLPAIEGFPGVELVELRPGKSQANWEKLVTVRHDNVLN